MNHQFQNNRSPTQQSNLKFYNPQKDIINPNNPILYQQQSTNGNFIPNSNSKSFISRSHILDPPKASNNASVYTKPIN